MARRPSAFGQLIFIFALIVAAGSPAAADGVWAGPDIGPAMEKLNNNSDFMQQLKDELNVSPDKLTACESYGIDKYKYDGVYRLLHLYFLGPFVEFQPQQNVIFVPQSNSVETFADKKTVLFINDLAKTIKEKMNLTLHVTAMTSGASTSNEDKHCGHRGGLSFDLRPLPGDAPTSYTDASYNRNLNKALLMIVMSNLQVSRVIFNDPQLLNDPDLQLVMNMREANGYHIQFGTMHGHDNHLHIELYPDLYFDAIVKALLASLAQPQ